MKRLTLWLVALLIVAALAVSVRHPASAVPTVTITYNPNFVQGTGAIASNANSISASFINQPTAGNLLKADLSFSGGTCPTYVAGWVTIDCANVPGTTFGMGVYYHVVVGGELNGYPFPIGAGPAGATLEITEFSGVNYFPVSCHGIQLYTTAASVPTPTLACLPGAIGAQPVAAFAVNLGAQAPTVGDPAYYYVNNNATAAVSMEGTLPYASIDTVTLRSAFSNWNTVSAVPAISQITVLVGVTVPFVPSYPVTPAPSSPTPTAIPTPTATPTASPSPTPSPTPIGPTPTPSPTPTAVPPTPTPLPTAPPVVTTYGNAVLSDKPIAYYQLDDVSHTMLDSSGNSQVGTTLGSVTLGATGLIATSSDTAISNSVASGPLATVPPSLIFSLSTAVSVECWVKVTTIGSAQALVAYGQSVVAPYENYRLNITAAGRFQFQAAINGVTQSVSTLSTYSSGTTYHVVGTYDGTNLRVYVTGALSNTVGAAGTLTNYTATGLELGSGSDGSGVFSGTLDEVAIYGSTLSPARILAHYQAGTVSYRNTVLADSPGGYYRLDDSSGTSMTDTSGNSNTGTYGAGVTLNATSLLATDSDHAAMFAGGPYAASKFATAPTNSTLAPTAAVSVEAWIKETAVNSSGYWTVAGYGADSLGMSYALQVTPTNAVRFYLRAATSGNGVASSTVLKTGTIYHLVGTYNGSTASLYINGNLNASSSTSGAISYSGISSNGLGIGGANSSVNPIFPGTIDEVAIYPTALSLTRIVAHYTSGSGINPVGNISGSGIKQWAWYGSSDCCGFNDSASVSGVTMAKYFFGVIVSAANGASLTTGFKSAGGSHAGPYFDNFFLYGYTKSGNVWNNTGTSSSSFMSGQPSSNFLVNSSGAVVQGAGGRITPYYAASGSQMAVASAVQTFLNKSYDTAFLDDQVASYGSFTSDGMGASSQVTNTTQLQSNVKNGLNAMSTLWHPMMNTLNTVDAGVNSEIQAYLQPGSLSPMGSMYEICVEDRGDSNGFPSGSANAVWVDAPQNNGNPAHAWYHQMDDLLYTQSLGKYSMCYTGAGATPIGSPGPRIYLMASMMMIYDPTYTTVWAPYVKGSTTDASAMPEFQIVPGTPLQTAVNSDVTTLKSGGVYRREFSRCTYNGVNIGNCATVLNANTTNQTIAGLVNTYSKIYVITNTNSLINPSPGSGSFSGGSINNGAALGGGTAAILAQ